MVHTSEWAAWRRNPGEEPVIFIDVYAPPTQWIAKWIEENQKPTDPSIYKGINVNNVLNRLDAKYPHTVR